MSSLFATFAAPGTALQPPFDVAVVMPTILRPTLADALRSVFAQRFPGRIQVLLGIDQAGDTGDDPDLSALAAAATEAPPHCVVQVLYPGYSTSVRHGGCAPPATAARCARC